MLYFQVRFVAVLSASADKQKRNILPGNPYYGSEHDHHHKYENEVQILKIAGYIGFYMVLDDIEDHSR